ncbi:MAG TPA: UDP-glucose 4-epimerase GalE [bacterium]|nr:UDP-glucose 4-epimerase GalE [bacterium]
MRLLVTGGAGYIGSHLVKLLGDIGNHTITILDNLSTGHRPAILYGDLIKADLADREKTEEIFKNGRFDAVIHFAAHIVVPESVSDPLKYYMNNTVNTTNLIRLCIKYGVGKFIFSSTAAVYGEPADGVVLETSALDPINPYGMSKLMSERVLLDTTRAFPDRFKAVILRYFNVAGADPDGKIGQSFPDATHLIKVAAQAALGKRPQVNIFGTDFPTPDGTGIRDYIHVTDLAGLHIRALEHLNNGGNSDIFNCGYGHGYSVREVLDAMKRVSGVDFKVVEGPRRPGDPAKLIANNAKVRRAWNWEPAYDSLEFICRTALDWEKKRTY